MLHLIVGFAPFPTSAILDKGQWLVLRQKIVFSHEVMTQSTLPSASSRRFSYGEIWKIAFPMLIGTLVEQLIGMTDTAFLGRVSEVALGASALGGIFFISVFMLIMGFSTGTQILMGRRNGEANYRDIGVAFYHGLGFLLLLSMLLFGLTQWVAPSILRLIISSQEVYEAAWEYLSWRMWGIFFSAIAVLFRAFYIATTRTSILKWNSMVMVVSNFVFDYVFIFGHFGVPAMGIAGAGIASALSSMMSMLFYITYTWRKVDFHRYGLDELPRFKPRLLGKLLGVSSNLMVQSFLSLSTWFLFFIAIEHLGTRELAVTNVLRSISAFTFMSLIAFASTASTLTSNLLGAGDVGAVRPMHRQVIRLAAFIVVPMWVVIALFPRTVLGIFTDDAAIISEGVFPLLILGTSYVFQIPSVVLFHSISGTGNTRVALWIEMLALAAYCVYTYTFVFYLRCSLSVAWGSELLYAFLCLMPSYAYFRWGKWYEKQL